MKNFCEIATFEALPAGDWLYQMFRLPTRGAYNLNFQNTGYDSVYMIENQGTVFFIIHAYFLAMFLTVIVPKVNFCKTRYVTKCNTKLGQLIYWNGLNRFFAEVYFERCIALLINLKFGMWNDFYIWLIYSNILSIIELTMIITAPISIVLFAYS